MTQAAAQTSTGPAAPASARIHLGERLPEAVERYHKALAASPFGRDAGGSAHPAGDDEDGSDAVASRCRYRGLDRLGRAVAAMGGVEDLVAQVAAGGPNLTLDVVSADRLSVLMSLVLDEMRTAEDELISEKTSA